MTAADPIYTLTVLCDPKEGAKIFSDARTWAWFPSLEEAVASLHKDTEFYFELGYYRYAVVEEVLSRSIGPHTAQPAVVLGRI